MKRIKLLTNLAFVAITAGSMSTIASCSCINEIKIKPELVDSSEGVKIKDSYIVKGKESTITLEIPEGKQIDTLEIKIGNMVLTEGTDYSIDSNNKITIKAEVVNGGNVTVKVIVKDKSVVTGLEITYEGEYHKDEAIKASNVTVKTKIGQQTSTTPLVWGSEYSIAKQGGQAIQNFDTVGYTFTQEDETAGHVDFVITYLAQPTITGEVNVIVTPAAKTFAETDLSKIITAIQTFENSKQDEAAMQTLCSTFSDTAYISEGTTVEGHLGNFIGKTKTIEINNQDHIIRVIGINHDELDTSTTQNLKYVAFSFDLVTLLSDSNGNRMASKWDASNNYDYTNSILRKNLTGNGSATGTGVWSNTALSMLPSELQAENVIKTVKKEVATYNTGTSSYTVTNYNDKLFPLSYTEMAQSGSSYAKEEGTAYKYWIEHNNDSDRIKKDAKGNGDYYLLISPYIVTETNLAWLVKSNEGKFDKGYVGGTRDVSFAFCI